MTKRKPKSQHKKLGAPLGNTNRPKGPEKRLVSGRLELPIYEALQARARGKGRTVSDEVSRILAQVLTV